MRIDCGNKIFLKSDSRHFFLAEEKKKKDGTLFDDPFAHYVDFHQAIEGLARHRLCKSKAKTFEGLHKDMEAIRDEVKKIREVFEFTVVKSTSKRP